MLKIFKGKEKTYKFNNLGLVQCKYDIKTEKKERINKITGVGMVLVMLALGWMSKEFVVLYFINLGIGASTDLFINK